MNRKGFSLIELLVVIAIIAILAAILFPTFQQVRNRTRETQCMTQMHDIYTALKVYKEDNNKYPVALLGFEQYKAPSGVVKFYQPDATYTPLSIDELSYKPLFNKQKYLKDDALFVCPNTKDKTKGPTTTAQYPSFPNVGRSGNYTFAPLVHNLGMDSDGVLPTFNATFFKYDNYDIQPKLNSTLDGPDPSGVYEVHYTLDWTGTSNSGDYASFPNQMKYGDKADDSHTVMTWCSEHALNSGSDKVLVLTLSGQTKVVDKKAFYSKGPLNILK